MMFLRSALRAEQSSFLFPACPSSLSDDNGKMDPHHLAVWTSIGVNYSTYKPTDEEILARYLLKFSKEAASGASHCLKVGQTANLLRIVITLSIRAPSHE